MSYAPPSSSQPQHQPEGKPPGGYEGKFISHEIGVSQVKGTPYIRLWFEVDGAEISTDIYITDKSAEIAFKQLKVLNWNGDPGDGCAFEPPDVVPLYLKYEDYKGKQQQRWSISTFERKNATAETQGALATFAAKYKMQHAAPPAPPGKPPARPAPPAASNGKPPAPPKPPAKLPKK